jgi:hypothetical protein
MRAQPRRDQLAAGAPRLGARPEPVNSAQKGGSVLKGGRWAAARRAHLWRRAAQPRALPARQQQHRGAARRDQLVAQLPPLLPLLGRGAGQRLHLLDRLCSLVHSSCRRAGKP